MLLLLDSDAFCVLAAAGLLDKACAALGCDGFARLAALPHMLRRGSLRKRLGDVQSDALIATAEALPVTRAPSAAWADRVAGIPDVDPGEAQLLAVAAEDDVFVITGDKRALAAVSQRADIAQALAGRVVLVEQILDLLCERDGPEAVRDAVNGSQPKGQMLIVCFSPDNPSPREALDAYIREARVKVDPLRLWAPPAGPGAGT